MGQSDSSVRAAFFGGSFDPPHLGHLAVARAARSGLGLDTVLFAPVGAQPLKPQGSTASFEDRVAMTRLAIAAEAGFAVSLADAPRDSGEPNYTVETLEGLRAGLPPGSRLFCLMGADAFLGLRQWHRAAEIPFIGSLIVASRPGQRLDSLKAALPEGVTMEQQPEAGEAGSNAQVRRCVLRNAAGGTAPLYLLPGLHVEISASLLRERIRDRVRVAGGDPGGGQELVPKAVLEYIRAHGLYGWLAQAPSRGYD